MTTTTAGIYVPKALADNAPSVGRCVFLFPDHRCAQWEFSSMTEVVLAAKETGAAVMARFGRRKNDQGTDVYVRVDPACLWSIPESVKARMYVYARNSCLGTPVIYVNDEE